ncbi:hypothetical protein [Cognataquiflexum rubidum]|uniref:hypothetical protein n=1 Tax=Cognataquiflexum rubidum TaxID=2922273 RepID=UPI001F141CA5|nr:hypothetical protein [Cognataquiflexum rubidum]MCH6233401.1 hypothetical protein [Cognataquiflexum rubidum]
MLKPKLLSPKSVVLILLSIIVIFSGCVKEESPEDVAIGEPFQGGVVGHIFEPGQEGYVEGKRTGIIIAPVEEVFESQWGCQGSAVGGTSTAVGTGRKNTELVLAFHDALPNYYTNPTQCHPANNGTVAARLTLDFNLGGFNDWFMPSLEEMNYLYDNRDKIGGFSDVEYWSSCESNANNACVMSFITGEQLSKPKSELRRVRVIRFF